MTSVLIEHGYVIPIEGTVDVIEDGAVAIEGNRIVAVGPTAEVRAAVGGAATVIDATGQAVIPGLVNTHAHLVGALNKGLTEDPPAGCSGLFAVAIPLHERYVNREDAYAANVGHTLEMLRTGTTCINENWFFEDEAARCLRDLGLRAVLGPMIREVSMEQFSATNPERVWDKRLADESFDEALRVIYEWNGAAGGRITARIAPLSPDTCSEDLLVRCREAAERLGVGYHVHLAQIPGEDLMVQKYYGRTPVEYMRDLGYLHDGFVGAHMVFMNESDVEIMAETGAHMSHTAFLVGKRGYFPPMPHVYRTGVSLALGTDWCSNDLWKTMRTAMVVARQQAGDPGIVDAKRILTAGTLGGARALQLQDKIGSLVPGKLADIAVVDMQTPWCMPVRPQNLISDLVWNANGSDVTHVLVDGEILVKDGQLTRFDERELLAETQRTANRVWERAAPLLAAFNP
jgi:5-methylthioadenosine/S-adenosylhomocysteine deaminase